MNKLNKGNNFVQDYFNKAISKNNPNTKYYFPIKLQLKNIEKNKLNENKLFFSKYTKIFFFN